MGCPGSPGLWAAVGFVALLIGSIAAVVIANYTASEEIERDFAWWHRMVIYHVYTPTFFDSDADGVGDLNDLEYKSYFETPATYHKELESNNACDMRKKRLVHFFLDLKEKSSAVQKQEVLKMLSLTASEAESLTSIWNTVKKDISGHGMGFFNQIFTSYPDLQSKFFPLMGGNDIVRLSNHGSKVIAIIGELAEHLIANSTDEYRATVEGMAKLHDEHRVTANEFRLFNVCLLEYLKHTFSPSPWNKATEATWKKFLDHLLAQLCQELNACPHKK